MGTLASIIPATVNYTVANGLDEPVFLNFLNRIFDLCLRPGVVSIGFALKFPYGSSIYREFSLENRVFTIWARELLRGSSSPAVSAGTTP